MGSLFLDGCGRSIWYAHRTGRFECLGSIKHGQGDPETAPSHMEFVDVVVYDSMARKQTLSSNPL